jgi:hypothetical protein
LRLPKARPTNLIHSLRKFWRRISNGVAPGQLWRQFQTETKASYRLYAQEVHWERAPTETPLTRFLRITRALFWAMMMKLSPGRRVLLLAALVLLASPVWQLQWNQNTATAPNLSVLGGIALLILLALELADRVSLKRDLEIAREIQNWLMPGRSAARTGSGLRSPCARLTPWLATTTMLSSAPLPGAARRIRNPRLPTNR